MTWKDTKQSIALAREYFDYMNYRKRLENSQAYNLPLSVYRAGTRMKIPFFFGVYNDGEKLTCDIENPNAFEKWLMKHNYNRSPSLPSISEDEPLKLIL